MISVISITTDSQSTPDRFGNTVSREITTLELSGMQNAAPPELELIVFTSTDAVMCCWSLKLARVSNGITGNIVKDNVPAVTSLLDGEAQIGAFMLLDYLRGILTAHMRKSSTVTVPSLWHLEAQGTMLIQTA